MASVFTTADGSKRVEFSIGKNQPRKTLYLGRVTAREAAAFAARVEQLLTDHTLHRPHEPELCAWLNGLDARMLTRLQGFGLVEPGVGLLDTTLDDLLQRFASAHAMAPQTATFYGHTARNLREFFGAGRLLRSITPAECDRWRVWLTETERLAAATTGRRVVAAKTIFRSAVRWGLLGTNAMDGVRGASQANPSRMRFVDRATVVKILDATTDRELRAVICLSRYGALRVPSEVLDLRWCDIDWSAGTLRVVAQKTGAARVVPLFPEVEAALLELFNDAEPSVEWVCPRHRAGCRNMRRELERLIDRTGVPRWPRLYHNMRSSRATELLRQFDLATVARWLGHTVAVLSQHYAQTIDLAADHLKATGREAQRKAQYNPQQREAEGSRENLNEQDGEAANPCKDEKLSTSFQLPATTSKLGKWAQLDSNQRLADYESAALTG